MNHRKWSKGVHLKKSSQAKSSQPPFASQMLYRVREGLFIIAVALSIFLLISFSTYQTIDPGWSSTGVGGRVHNLGGRAGSFLSDFFLSLFGAIGFLLPPLITAAGWFGIRKPSESESSFNYLDFIFKCVGFILIVMSGCGLMAVYLHYFPLHLPASNGGILGDLLRTGLTQYLNEVGAGLFLITGFLCGITLFTGLSWIALIDLIGSSVMDLGLGFKKSRKLNTTVQKTPSIVKKPAHSLIEEEDDILEKEEQAEDLATDFPLKKRASTMGDQKIVIAPQINKPKPKKLNPTVIITPGSLPPITLLDAPPPPEGKAFSNTTFEELSQLVEQRLLDFGVEVRVVAVHPGPIITRFELELAPGMKVSKISGLAKDIARSLSLSSVRIVEVIPGKSVIGLELPNEHRELVVLRDILESQHYSQSKSPVSLALGKDIAGYPVVVDLAKMPHLLVAGTTGSGKSVSINAMILSMLLKATPTELRLILIDPKMLELSVYEGVPHLLTPVITDMKDAANSLRWCVAEMDRRYKLMATLGVRNLSGYNLKVQDSIKQGHPIPAPSWLAPESEQPNHLESLPIIVVVVDELADMMMVVGKKVEDLITRIAQKARAAGIHLILATQRPSVDVITGLIKANVPTRVAFQVSSRIDSRTILDQQGAEQLLGNGDMLYLPPGTGVPIRVHGAFVGDEEVHRVVAAWQTFGKPDYLEEVIGAGSNDTNEGESSGEMDPLYDEALKIVTESRRASISLVQRRLKIGYNRAARIMEDMEAAGVVSTMDTNGSREVLAPPPIEI